MQKSNGNDIATLVPRGWSSCCHTFLLPLQGWGEGIVPSKLESVPWIYTNIQIYASPSFPGEHSWSLSSAWNSRVRVKMSPPEKLACVFWWPVTAIKETHWVYFFKMSIWYSSYLVSPSWNMQGHARCTQQRQSMAEADLKHLGQVTRTPWECSSPPLPFLSSLKSFQHYVFIGEWTWHLCIAATTPGSKIFLHLLLPRLLLMALNFSGTFPLPSEARTLPSVKSLHEMQLGVKVHKR